MPNFTIKLDGFCFPSSLSNDKANFRFLVDLRFLAENGQFAVEHAVMPSLDTFWECDTRRSDRPNYVRRMVGGSPNGSRDTAVSEGECGDCGRQSRYGMFDISESGGRIDEWDRLVLAVKADRLHSIQFKVIDVDRNDAWDKIRGALAGIAGLLAKRLAGSSLERTLSGTEAAERREILPSGSADVIRASLGGAPDDVRSFMLKKLAGGDDVLFRGSRPFPRQDLGSLEIAGCGTEGCYKLQVSWERW